MWNWEGYSEDVWDVFEKKIVILSCILNIINLIKLVKYSFFLADTS